ncbi:hypothetical protein FO440_09995 [Mucilaginibacter corticis]|uniref:Uncharacterized protein n=1 Tax=Mucilaginibacter corticis TaxID=2597670 RepID=A0A556MX74_9SPHI|nr:hypothetical protein [Mucilaginibacter corticis]TSJ44485.1 hypothetical protein FO440_09995 [Mucilaginibacter corticis]
MSSAFIKEGESEQLRDIAPNMASLLQHLAREYGGPVRELQTRTHPKHQKEVHEMSDGLGYMLNEQNQWQVILD